MVLSALFAKENAVLPEKKGAYVVDVLGVGMLGRQAWSAGLIGLLDRQA
jgi:hypothetical protein